jgi:hypothetical protein
LCEQLSSELNVKPEQVARWFSNERSRKRKKEQRVKIELEYEEEEDEEMNGKLEFGKVKNLERFYILKSTQIHSHMHQVPELSHLSLPIIHSDQAHLAPVNFNDHMGGQ